MTKQLAQLISIVGHPAMLMPIAAAITAKAHKGHEQLFLSVMIAIIFAIFVFVYSQVKARIGHWEHVDASNKSERKELNQTSSITLFVSAVVLALLKVHPGIVTAVALAGAIVISSHFFSRIAKPSLHVSFAIFAACLTWPNTLAFLILILLTICIGWARLYLKRHTRLDVIIGTGLGVSAGICFHIIIRML